MPYRTRTWCDVTCGARDTERDQCRALRVHGKCGPQTGEDPHHPVTRKACRRVLWHTCGKRCIRDQWAAGSGKKAPVPPGRCCSETKKCGHTASTPTLRQKRLRSSRAAGTPWSCTWARVPVRCREMVLQSRASYAWQRKIAEEKNRDPPHPDSSDA